MLGAFSRITSPGLPARSALVGTPPWKSACVVSVRQPLVDDALREKSTVVVAPSLTSTLRVVLELNPAKVAAMLGYVPEGIPVKEYVPSAAVVAVLLPSATVTPAIGAPPAVAVTVPFTAPAATGVQLGKLKAPMRVLKFTPFTW